MKEQFEKNQKIKVIIIGVASTIIIILTISLYFVKGSNYNDKVKSNLDKRTTTTAKKDETNYVDAITVSNADYGLNNNSKAEYYVPGFIIYEDNLYADLGSSALVDDIREKSIKINNADAYLLKEGLTKAFIVEQGSKGYHYAFAINAEGQLFYINHFASSKLKMLEVIEIPELKNITDVQSAEGRGKNAVDAYAIDANGEEHNLSDIIDKYAKMK